MSIPHTRRSALQSSLRTGTALVAASGDAPAILGQISCVALPQVPKSALQETGGKQTVQLKVWEKAVKA